MQTDRAIAITGGDIVTPAGVIGGDVLLLDGRIAAIGEVPAGAAATTLDASGKLVIPGGVDVHTHLDMEVGVTRSADDFFTGTRAAACGGTTTVVDFATAYQGESAREGLAKWHDKARGRAVVDYGFHMSVTELKRPAAELVAEMAQAGVTTFKLYMTYADRLMVPDEVISEVMAACGNAGAMLALHCEDDPTITRLRAEALAAGHTGPSWHARTRPASAETTAVERAIVMAEANDAPVYIVHVSSGETARAIAEARGRGVRVYGETCPHYLFLTDEPLMRDDDDSQDYVCAPPLRSAGDRALLWDALVAGHLQVVSTDHCPFTRTARRAGVDGGGWSDFTQIPGGLPGIETRLSLIYQKVVDGTLQVERWVDICCTNPAKLFGMHPRKGTLEVGSDADVVVFDPAARRRLVDTNLHMRVDHSPYADVEVTGWPDVVISGGRIVAQGGEPADDRPLGRFLERGPSGVVTP